LVGWHGCDGCKLRSLDWEWLVVSILFVVCLRSWVLVVDESLKCTKTREVAGFISGIEKGSVNLLLTIRLGLSYSQSHSSLP
jgi:hypothetical protein